MIRELFQLVQSAVCRDRIRVPPSDGRLLRLSPPCVLMIGTETVSIVGRTVGSRKGRPCVRYELESQRSTGTLVVELQQNLRCEITLEASSIHQPIAEDDIVVFG